jgi:TPR repeat protein
MANDLYDRAVKALDAGCARGDQRSCQSGVELFRLVRSVPIADGAMAARFYTRACDARMGAGCHLAAGLYDRGRLIALDRQRAANLYERGCDAGEIDSCLRLAEMYRLGQGVGANPGLAAELAQRAAELRRQRRR